MKKIAVLLVLTLCFALSLLPIRDAIAQPCDCDLTPDTTIITRGETLEIDVTVTNNTGWAGNLYFGGKVTTEWVNGPIAFSIAAYGQQSGHMSYDAPTSWPVGTYTYHGYVGIPGVGIYCESQFDFVVATGVPKTGQTLCYDETGTEIPCAGTGQDGEHQKGTAWPNPRFTDNGDGTVTDNLTGLIWLKDANCISTNYPGFDNDGGIGDGNVFWQHALDFVTGINDETYPDCGAGFTDWRLPNIRELHSLIHFGFRDPALANTAGTGKWTQGEPFSNVESLGYWSATTVTLPTDHAWSVYLNDGHVIDYVKVNPYFVWPVRGGN